MCSTVRPPCIPGARGQLHIKVIKGNMASLLASSTWQQLQVPDTRTNKPSVVCTAGHVTDLFAMKRTAGPGSHRTARHQAEQHNGLATTHQAISMAGGTMAHVLMLSGKTINPNNCDEAQRDLWKSIRAASFNFECKVYILWNCRNDLGQNFKKNKNLKKKDKKVHNKVCTNRFQLFIGFLLMIKRETFSFCHNFFSSFCPNPLS